MLSPELSLDRDAREEPGVTERPSRPAATTRLRLVGYAVIITALAFSQETGRIIQDTKFDLVADPLRFLGDALHLWDPGQSFGQLRNQAYGYLWPMGPAFLLGKLVALPAWVIQRLWWALLLNLAFFGMLRLVQALRVGRPWTQVAAAAAFVLAPRITSLLGTNSVEIWPTAIAPWVLLALVRGTERGSVLRAGGLAALAVACCGGVNATAVAAVLPAGVVWILTRSRGPRRMRLLAAWTGFTVLASLWWLGPLVVLGRYSPPFLDYIETAWMTQAVTDLSNSLLSTSNWVVYVTPGTYPAGTTILTTGFVLLDAAVIVALGLFGILSVRQPHRRFLSITLLVGLVLVGFGYVGELHGWWANERHDLLDQALAPLRNSHKFDVPVRLALCVGVAHGLAVLAAWRPAVPQRPGLPRLARSVLGAATALALCGLALPWAVGQVASPRGVTEVPSYWQQTADYLDDELGDASGTSLVVPATPFGDYGWGSTHDDVLQPLARSSWAARSVLPLAPAGNVVLLDRLTEILESGRPSSELAPMLRAVGVGALVVRNDLDRLLTGAPDPAYLHATLDASPGLDRVAEFGPEVGSDQVIDGSDGTRVVPADGVSGRYRAVEVYRVLGGSDDARLSPTTTAVVGGPADAAEPGSSGVLAADLEPGAVRRVVLTDGLQRREKAFQGVRQNESATQRRGSVDRVSGPESFHRLLPDQERWQTTEAWDGILGVRASSSAADADAPLPLDRGSGPAAALDGDEGTAWRTSRAKLPGGQWIQLDLDGPTDVRTVTVSVSADAAPVQRLRIDAGERQLVVAAPRPGRSATISLGARGAESIRVTALGEAGLFGQWGISELSATGVETHRLLELPAPPASGVVDQIRLRRDAERSACPVVDGTVACQPLLAATGEDGEQLRRAVTLTTPAPYGVEAVGSLRRDPALGTSMLIALGVRLTVSDSLAVDVAESAVALVDGDPGTTWRASSEDDPRIEVRFDRQREVRSVTLDVGSAAAVSRPDRVRISDGKRERLARVDGDGEVTLPGWRTDRLEIDVLSTKATYDRTGAGAIRLPVGVSELLVNGEALTDGSLTAECGTGPMIEVSGQQVHTEVTTTLSAALRGEPVELTPCADASLPMPEGRSLVEVSPSRWFRADRVTLTREGAMPATPRARLEVSRDDRGNPVSTRVPASATSMLLTLPQNVNDGWVATLGGKELFAQRVGGWQHGWIVPAGESGTVRFAYPPDRTYRLLLLTGFAGLLVVLGVVVATWRRRSTLPALAAGAVTRTDALLGCLLIGLLAGWIGVAVTLAVALATRRRPEVAWGPVAGAAALAAVLPRVLPGLEGWSSAAWAAQALSVLAVAVVAGSLLAKIPRFFSRRNGSSSQRYDAVAASTEATTVTRSTSPK